LQAADVIKDFYVSLREASLQFTQLPVTTRQLESLIRLAQARAKVSCREEVSKEDALVEKLYLFLGSLKETILNL
jgi:DNA helicase MCM8